MIDRLLATLRDIFLNLRRYTALQFSTPLTIELFQDGR
jgi:hypothetical protein